MVIKYSIYLITLLFLISSIYGKTIHVKLPDNLQKEINNSQNNDTLIISKGTYKSKRNFFIEPLCGNCQNHQTDVEASYGFILKNKSLVIIGQSRTETILITNSGYGFYFENSPNSKIMNLTITGGKRDVNGNATDAGIVARKSKVEIINLDIINNDDRLDSVVVGIGGVFGREQSELKIMDCNIINNGWDGVALYRGASAVITDCLIKDGRGAGIGVTWDATCNAYRNEIRGFWKGIGAFGTSWVIARNNLVHENLGWGIIATGHSFMDITNNVVNHNGNCGVAPWGTGSRGRIMNNIITGNGWREYWVCPCYGVWNYGDWSKWDFRHNIVWNNKEGDYKDIWDQTDLNGNLSIDPKFTPDSLFNLLATSPALNAGDSVTYNVDGSRSHIGLTGGPQAK